MKHITTLLFKHGLTTTVVKITEENTITTFGGWEEL
jgi:hypothetical protein